MDELRCRPAGAEDFTFLATMLGEAAVWRPDKPTPTAEQVMADPRYAMYLAGWPRQGDYGLVAEQDRPVGAAWYRTYTEANHGYGFVAEDVPELSIAVIASRRHEGIGRRLLVDLIEASVAQGFRALSLSVAENNPARRLYESTGFVLVDKHGHSCTMVRPNGRSAHATASILHWGEIRELGVGSAEQLVALFAAVLPESPTAQAEGVGEADAFLRDPSSFVLGAYTGDTPVGLAWGLQMRSPSGRLTTYVHELEVHEHWRRQGVGSALIQEAMTVARRQGSTKFWLSTGGQNEAAQALYESLGGDRKPLGDVNYWWNLD